MRINLHLEDDHGDFKQQIVDHVLLRNPEVRQDAADAVVPPGDDDEGTTAVRLQKVHRET